jgi:hypothetical protein
MLKSQHNARPIVVTLRPKNIPHRATSSRTEFYVRQHQPHSSLLPMKLRRHRRPKQERLYRAMPQRDQIKLRNRLHLRSITHLFEAMKKTGLIRLFLTD